MSSILKALQKVEEKKAAARNAGRFANEISRTRHQRGEKPRWLLPVTMISVVIVTVLATYALMGGFSQGTQLKALARIDAAAPLPQTRPEESPLPPVADPPVSDPVTVLPMITRPITVKVPSVPTKKKELPEAAAAAENKKASSPTIATEPPAVRVVEPHPQRPAATVAPAVQAATDLTVSGIAWQKESTSRLAVVNGVPVIQGAIVAGARVEEILPDRVRFTQESRSFEVFLGKTSVDK